MLVKILFVCHGNICRSPMAEFIMKYITRNSNKYYIASAATSNEETGNDIYPPAKKVLEKHHIPYEYHQARTIKKEDYDKYDYIIIMDSNNEYNIRRIIKDDPFQKIRKLLSFDGTNDDVSDPWYTNEFEKCYQDIYRGCVKLLEYLDNMTSKN